MTRHPHLDPAPFFLEGGPVGVLLVHGFTGSPPEMRLVGDYLHQRVCWPKSTSVRKLCTMISFCSTLTADSRTDVLFGQDKAPLRIDLHDSCRWNEQGRPMLRAALVWCASTGSYFLFRRFFGPAWSGGPACSGALEWSGGPA